jgi:PAS domain-containing protein
MSPGKPIEVILARQLASCLAMPIFIVDQQNTLIFYNELAEEMLGSRFAETGEIPAGEWTNMFAATDEKGRLLDRDALPLGVALRERQPKHMAFWAQRPDGMRWHIEATAFPLIGQAARFLGAIAIFWEVTS